MLIVYDGNALEKLSNTFWTKDETDIPQRLSDEQARDLLEQICGCRDSAQFQHLPIDRQRTIVAQAATQGAAINQLARITGLSYRQVYKTVKKK